jgi:hypothetical protein
MTSDEVAILKNILNDLSNLAEIAKGADQPLRSELRANILITEQKVYALI